MFVLSSNMASSDRSGWHGVDRMVPAPVDRDRSRAIEDYGTGDQVLVGVTEAGPDNRTSTSPVRGVSKLEVFDTPCRMRFLEHRSARLHPPFLDCRRMSSQPPMAYHRNCSVKM